MMMKLKKISNYLFVCLLISSSAVYAQDKDILQNGSLEELLESFDALLDDVVSTASKTKQKESEAPAIVTVITANDIQNMGATCIEDVLRIVPGFDTIAQANIPISDISVRGLPYGIVKILVNGYTLTNYYMSNLNQQLLSFPLDLIERIEIVRGPGSALYGTNAFNAIIQIFTKDGSTSTRVNIEGGSCNTIHPSAEFAIKKDNLKTFIYADYFNTNGPAMLIEKDLATKIFPSGLSSAPGNTINKKNGTFLMVRSSLKNFTFDVLGAHLNIRSPVGISFALVDDENITTDMYNIGLRYERPFHSGKGLFSIKGYYYYNANLAEYEIFNETISKNVYDNPAGYQLLTWPSLTMSQTDAEIDVQDELLPNLHIIVGASFEHQSQFNVKNYATYNLTPNDITIDGIVYPPNEPFGGKRDITEQANWNENKTRNIGAAFLQTTWDIKKASGLNNIHSAAMTFGIRYDHYSDVGRTVNPRIGLVIAPAERYYFKGLYGSAFHAPELTVLHMQNSPVLKNNPNLKPEDIDTYELLAGYYLSKHMVVTISGFYSKVTNKYVETFPLGVTKLTHLNIGKFASKGIETELKMRLPGGYFGFFNMTYQSAKDISHLTVSNGTTSFIQGDFKPGLVPSFILNLGGNYIATSNINLNINLNYISARKRSEEEGYDADGSIVQIDLREDLEPRLLINGAVIIGNFSFLPNLKLKLTGKNLLDADYRDPVASGNVPNDLPRYGREFMAKLMVTF
jgi:outer membrane cobalamin receptor